jgi:hypothetical protein
MPIDITANFIRIRVASPKDFIRFRVKTLGAGIKAVIGFRRGGGSQIQSVLFPKSRYSLASARAWIKKHGMAVHETYLVTDISVGVDYIDFEEVLVTPEMEIDLVELESHAIDVKNIKKETWAWLFD